MIALKHSCNCQEQRRLKDMVSRPCTTSLTRKDQTNPLSGVIDNAFSNVLIMPSFSLGGQDTPKS